MRKGRKKQVWLYSILRNCKYVTQYINIVCSVLTPPPPPPPKKKKEKQIVKLGIFCLELGKNNILFGIGNGAELRPQNRVMESPDIH